jgi:hypothetical protein
MKTSIIRSLLLFAAGAGCATVIAQVNYKEAMTPEQFLEQAPVLLTEIATIGASVAGISGGKIYLSSNPPIACFPPPNPKMPDGAVSPTLLRNGLEALMAYNEARIDAHPEPVQVTGKCHIAGE